MQNRSVWLKQIVQNIKVGLLGLLNLHSRSFHLWSVEPCGHACRAYVRNRKPRVHDTETKVKQNLEMKERDLFSLHETEYSKSGFIEIV